jgi:hypothetical protein
LVGAYDPVSSELERKVFIMEPIEIVLRPGQSVKITMFETDGEFIIDYAAKEEGVLSVFADIEDTSGRMGEIYREEFGQDASLAIKKEIT